MTGPAPAEALERALGRITVWPPDLAPDDRYVPLPDLLSEGVAHRISRRLSDAPLRVGQSALVMGLASRLWSLTVVTAARDDVVLDPDAMCARDDDGSLVLGVSALRGRRGLDPLGLHDVVMRVLAPIVEALPLAPRLLWGNVAGSLAGVPRVHDLPAAVPLVADLLRRAPLVGELDLSRPGQLRRHTCCLFYLVPGGGLCGDCALDRVPSRPTGSGGSGR